MQKGHWPLQSVPPASSAHRSLQPLVAHPRWIHLCPISQYAWWLSAPPVGTHPHLRLGFLGRKQDLGLLLADYKSSGLCNAAEFGHFPYYLNDNFSKICSIKDPRSKYISYYRVLGTSITLSLVCVYILFCFVTFCTMVLMFRSMLFKMWQYIPDKTTALRIGSTCSFFTSFISVILFPLSKQKEGKNKTSLVCTLLKFIQSKEGSQRLDICML